GYHGVSLSLYRVSLGSKDRTADIKARHGKLYTGFDGTPADLSLGWGDFPYRTIVGWLIDGKSFRKYLPVTGPDGRVRRSNRSVKREKLSDEEWALVKSTQVANQDRMYRVVPQDFNEWLRVEAS